LRPLPACERAAELLCGIKEPIGRRAIYEKLRISAAEEEYAHRERRSNKPPPPSAWWGRAFDYY